ncbi:rod shape-determining protein MreC [Sunxiuqinia sp. A32]|uniref:rod shape-determining protein MreC n=1 Tax=Sunxiuqinia sp. A32 TaxID=3461496 RepID=UPI004045352C
MRSLLRFLARNYFFLLFLVFEAISLVLIVNYNNYQKVKFLNSSNRISGNLFNTYNSVYSYFQLNRVNEELAKDNALLRKRIQDMLLSEMQAATKKVTQTGQNYDFVPVRVINNSVNKQYNYITLNKGSANGIKPDMGIIGPGGVVGVITNVSEHFSTGQSVLNKRWGLSAKINNYFGSLVWDGIDYRYAKLNEIPFHVTLHKGDEVITSSYSSIFPEGIRIGRVHDFKQVSGGNFYDITVELSSNFKTLSYVEVVSNLLVEEQLDLEELNKND